MPGPLSNPSARKSRTEIVKGKTALKRTGLKSGEGLTHEDNLFGKRKAEELLQQKLDAQQDNTPTDLTQAIKEIRKDAV